MEQISSHPEIADRLFKEIEEQARERILQNLDTLYKIARGEEKIEELLETIAEQVLGHNPKKIEQVVNSLLTSDFGQVLNRKIEKARELKERYKTSNSA